MLILTHSRSIRSILDNELLASASSTESDSPSKPLYTVPTIKEYFQDLDEVLSVISDGPAKSFAFRRLRYLESKWNLYVLLNEYRELAEMKVRRCLLWLCEALEAERDCPAARIAPRLLQRPQGRHARPSLG